jgi:hypothetical protein
MMSALVYRRDRVDEAAATAAIATVIGGFAGLSRSARVAPDRRFLRQHDHRRIAMAVSG